MLLLALGAAVLETGEIQVQPGAAAGHVEAVAGADAPVLLVHRVQPRHPRFDDVAVVVLDFVRDLGDVAVGLHEETVHAQPAAVADVGAVGDIGRVVAAVLHLVLVLPAEQLAAAGVGVAVRALDLAAVAVLHVDAGQQAPAQRLAAGHRAEGGVELAVEPAVDAHAQVAAVELVGVAQHDVDGAGHRVAAAVGAGAAQDLDVVHHFGRDAVHPERAVVAGAGHLLAVDQHLGIAGGHAAHHRAVELHDVRADEGHARHALEHVADGIGLEALEVLQVVGQHRFDVGGAVAVGDLALDHDGVQLLRFARAVRGAIRTGLGERRARRQQGGADEGVRQAQGQGVAFHRVEGPWVENERNFHLAVWQWSDSDAA